MNIVGKNSATVGFDQPNVETVPAADAPTAAPSGNPGHTMVTDEDRRFVATIEAEFGPVVRRLSSGRPRLNPAALGRIVAYRLQLAYNPGRREFVHQRPEQAAFEPLAMETVTHQVTVLLQRLAAIHPTILGEIHPRRIETLIRAMRVAAPQIRPATHQGLIDYVGDRLCTGHGHNLTTEEIHADYLAYARQRNIPLYARIKFHVELARMVFDQFAIPRVNNVLRPVKGITRLTARRGFNGLEFRTDGSDGSFTNGSVMKPA
jgi:hypothetical protein